MAEIGCNWARIGPSKSSQSLSNAHKWAVIIVSEVGESFPLWINKLDSGAVQISASESNGSGKGSRNTFVFKMENKRKNHKANHRGESGGRGRRRRQDDGHDSIDCHAALVVVVRDALRVTARMAVHVPPAMSPGLSASMADVATMSESTFRKRFRSSYNSSPSSSPPDFPSRKRYRGTGRGPVMVVESRGLDDESHGLRDKSRGLDDEVYSVESDGLGLGEEEEEGVPKGQQWTVLVVRTAVSAPLGLGYGALRHRELTLKEDHVYSTFEVGQGSGSAPEPERPERVSAYRQPTLTTWTNPEDGMVYIDVPAYPPPAPPVQTPPSPEWSSGSLTISPSHSIVLSPISSPMIPLTVPSPVATPATAETEGFLTELGAQVEMQGGLIRDHAVRLEELSPDLFERYDRDIGELFTRSGAVTDEIFSQRYRFRSQTDAQRAALWHAISDTQGENRELRLQLAEERRARLELAEIVDNMRRGQEPRGDV
ncbi:hypothetical protein Tco_0585409 [Tanacetum coccineum]